MIKQHCKFDKNFKEIEYTEVNLMGEIYREFKTYHPNGQINTITNNLGEEIKYNLQGVLLWFKALNGINCYNEVTGVLFEKYPIGLTIRELTEPIDPNII